MGFKISFFLFLASVSAPLELVPSAESRGGFSASAGWSPFMFVAVRCGPDMCGCCRVAEAKSSGQIVGGKRSLLGG